MTDVSKPRVAILVNSLLAGGAERFVSLILNELQNKFEFHLLLLDHIVEYDLPPDQIVVDLAANGVRSADLANTLRLPLIARHLKKYCADNQVQLVVSFLSRPNLAACLAKRFGMNAKLLISERTHPSSNFPADRLRGRIARFFVSSLYPAADAILTNSRGAKVALENDFGIKGNYRVTKNAIVLEDVGKQIGEPVEDVDFNRFTFVCVAGFRLVKNHRMLIEAFHSLDHPDSQLLLIGTGYKDHGEGFRVLKEIEELVVSLGLESRVLFLGQKTNPFKYLGKSDCFVLSSDLEGFPNVLIEALACGLPIISTDCPTGPREILSTGEMELPVKQREFIRAGYGILTPVGDPTSMARAMQEMMDDTQLRESYAAKGPGRAAEYDSKIVMKEFEQILVDHLTR